MSEMTPERLTAIEARANAAPNAPWKLSPPHQHKGTSGRDARQSVQSPNGTIAVALGAQCGRKEFMPIPGDERGRSIIKWHDEPLDSEAGAFIAASRSDVPDLCAALRQSLPERDALRSDVERLSAKVEAMEEGAMELRRRAEAAEAERDKYRSGDAHKACEIDDLRGEVEEWQDKAVDARRERDAAAAEVVAMREAAEAVIAGVTELGKAGRNPGDNSVFRAATVTPLLRLMGAVKAPRSRWSEIAEARRKVCASVGRWHRIWQEDNGLAAGYGSRLDDAENDMRETWARLSATEGGER